MIDLETIRGKDYYLKVGVAEEYPQNDITSNISSMKERERHKKLIEPWLSASLQAEHVALLLGAGFTTSICGVAGVESSSMSQADFGEYSSKIQQYASITATKMRRGNPNIEDQIRTAISLLEGYIIAENEDDAQKLDGIINTVLEDFSNSILSSETNLLGALKSASTSVKEKAEKAVSLLESFLLTFASRNATRERTHIFTTNYDRFVEYGCDLAGIKVLDRFWGMICPRFRESPENIDYYYHSPDLKNEFRYAEGVVRYSKLHGSVDWYEDNGIIYRDGLRFGASELNMFEGKSYKDYLMIYPNSMKSIETIFYPYSELFRDFSSAICKPNTTFFTYGYGFGDSHINKLIKEMLCVPSTHIVILSYGVDDKLIDFLSQINTAQATVLAGKEFGSIENLVQYYLPKPAIDTITERTSKLIDSRKGLMKIDEGGNENDGADYR